jgi:hypothetical protein
MGFDDRLPNLEAKLRRTGLLLMGIFGYLLMICTVTATSPFVDLVCRSLAVKPRTAQLQSN